jgi:hypothetical protein
VPAFLPSELPVRASTRHHWITLLRAPHRYVSLALAVLLLSAVLQPMPMAFILGIAVAVIAFLRWQTWTAEWVILTGKRIIRVQGVPETTSSEASLRVDRISGARLVETVPGKVLKYGTIELEAPGDHPDVRRLHKIANARPFYFELRRVVFGDDSPADPDDEPFGAATTYGRASGAPHLPEQVTEPLPVVEPWPPGRRPRG